ncbi:MAG: hypothetical protein CR955_00690 [Thiotrichales bacterium]|nr:MAG: hypothetical protein CR955_00690 [Thiotrichales bacterium]
MKKIYLILTACLFIAACGGGSNSSDSNDSSNSSNISADNANTTTATSNARDAIQGDWITSCLTSTDGKSAYLSSSFSTKDGNNIFIRAIASYYTSNCSGQAKVLALGGPITYKGERATSICTAEKIDQEVIIITDGETKIVGDDAQDFLRNEGFSPITYDLACQLNNQLFLGLKTETYTTSESTRRPIEMNTSIPYHIWDRSSSAKGNKSLSLTEKMTRISNDIKNLTK